jgi:hypothetical protein
MAITRAQQAKQMLREGGRLGYRFGGGYQGSDPDTGSGGASKGPSGGGGGGKGGNDGGNGGNQNTGNAREDYITNYVSKSRVKGPKVIGLDGKETDSYSVLTPTQIDNARKFKEEQDKKRSRTIFSNTGFNPFVLSNLTRKGLYNILPNNPNTELAFLSGLTQEQVDALDNKELSDLYSAIQDADFSGDLSFKDALGDKYEKLSFDAFNTLSKRGVDTNFQDPQGEFGNMDFAEYAARIKGQPGLLFSGNVGNIQTIKNKDGTYSFVEKQGDDGPDNTILFPQNTTPGDGNDSDDDDDTNTGGLALRFRKDGGRINAMDGGMMSPEGGIMDLETGRQMYFLGKLVKKATRAVKKIVKSPIGKAAILGGAMYFGGGAGAGKLGSFFGKGSFNPLKALITKGPQTGMMGGSGLGNLLAKFGLAKEGALTGKGLLALGGGALTLSPFLFQGDEEEEDQTIDRGPSLDIAGIRNNPYNFLGRAFVADGGIMRAGYQEGSKEPVAKKTMPLLDMDGKEMDLRDDGGFVPLGRMERADDVPARLSKNEFVFTADAVRNAGEGDVDKGAEVMYNMMKNLESGGEVSEESQGLQGAREMFQTSKRLEEVL